MADSLRDQLLKAGFAESKPAARRKHKQRRTPSGGKAAGSSRARDAQPAVAATDTPEQQRRKAAKLEIKALIDGHAIQPFAGEHAWHYQVDSRIRQAFVTEEVRRRLVDGELVLTRLNGTTHVIPADIGDAILEINPDWVVFRQATSSADEAGDYAEYPVPDDLQW